MSDVAGKVCSVVFAVMLTASLPVAVYAEPGAGTDAPSIVADGDGAVPGGAEGDFPAAERPGDGDGDEQAHPSYTGWVDDAGEPCQALDAIAWVDRGVTARSKFFFDPETASWYWAESDGSIAHDREAFVPVDNTVAGAAWEQADDAWRVSHGKWVHLGKDGAVDYGFLLVSDGLLGSKWVFCEYDTGAMAHGERYIDGSHGDEPGWMYFDPVTGAVDYGWAWLRDSGKWVYYDEFTGRMCYGSRMIDGKPYYLDPLTGARLSSSEVAQRLIATAASQNGITDGDRYQNAVIAGGGSADPMGPCAAFVYWCFQEAGMKYQLMDGGATAYPHEMGNWYRERGRLESTPRPGDIWLIDQPAFRPWPDADPGTHAGIIASVAPDGKSLYAWEHIFGRVQLLYEDLYIPNGSIVGFARPYYNE